MPLTFIFLAAAILAVWLPAPRIGGVVLPLSIAAAATGAATGVLQLAGLAALAVLAALAWAGCRAPRARGLFTLLAALWALAMALHKIPGFDNPKLIDGLRLRPDTLPFSVSLNFDKAAAGLVLLAAFCRPERRAPDARAVAWTLGSAAATCVVALGLAVLMGLTRIEPGWPEGGATFLAGNLLFTCVAEEVFFRGLIQERLTRWSQARGLAAGPALAVVVGAVLFGLAHAGGGAAYAAVAGVAGLGYGLAYAATRRIEAAILVHFALNAVHFTLFAYPMLAR